MWPNQSIDFVKLEQDPWGKHYGIFADDVLVSCVSLFIDGDSAQFRKLATNQDHRRKGYASALIEHVIAICHENKVKRIWCNARFDKTDFYEHFGLMKTEETFSKQGISFVVMELIL